MPSPSTGSARKLLLARSRAMFHYFSAQGLTMAANLLFGLLCVRLLPASEYAKFAVLFGVFGTLVVLMDLNFTGTLIPLVGERVADHKWIADHVASLRTLSYHIFAVVAAGTIIAFPCLVKHRAWSVGTVASMIGILLVSTWFVRLSSAYGAVLILFRARPRWYRAQMISAVGTLVALLILAKLRLLGAFTAILLNVLGIAYVGIAYYVDATKLLQVNGESQRRIRRSIINLALPNVPQAIFFALQGQISLFLITFFGKTTSVASVGALGRLAAIFIIFKQANSIFTEPYFAKLPRQQLVTRYVLAILVGAILSFTWLFPSVLLMVLGPQYQGLNTEVLISVASGALAFVSNLLWTIHSSRRFVYWWNVSLSILLTVVVQILFMVKADMSTIRGVLYLNLGQNFVSLFVNILSGAYGLIYGPRDTTAKQSS
jgi:O-antigen/teichoic acid export membrane protein